MKILEPISTIMTSNLVKLNIDDELTKAEMLFKLNKIRHIPVLQNNKVVGMLSFSDLQRSCFSEDNDTDEVQGIVYNVFTINQIMTKQVVSVFPWTPIKEVAEILSNSNFHALPVIQDDVLVGIVSTIDLLKYYISKY